MSDLIDEKALAKALALHPLPVRSEGYLRRLIYDYESGKPKWPESCPECFANEEARTQEASWK